MLAASVGRARPIQTVRLQDKRVAENFGPVFLYNIDVHRFARPSQCVVVKVVLSECELQHFA